MRTVAAAFASGAIFGLGLIVSGMTRPAKVLAFLDVTGNWDPSLALVMGGALGIHALLYPLVRRRRAPLFAPRFLVPSRRDIDRPLVLGAAIFGVGWGLAGYCPGPALTALPGGAPATTFVVAMLAGMLLERMVRRREAPATPDPEPAPGNPT